MVRCRSLGKAECSGRKRSGHALPQLWERSLTMRLASAATIATLAVTSGLITTTAVTAAAETSHSSGKPRIASVVGAADVRLTYLNDDDIRSFAFAARAAPYTRGPLPTGDGGSLPGSPNDAAGTVKITHYAAQWNMTFTAEGQVDSMVTAPGYASLTAVITTVSAGGPDHWIGKRLGFSVYDAGKDTPRGSRDRVGFSWEFMNMTKNNAGEWTESEIGTSMAPAPFAPVVDGGYTITHADLPPVPPS
ncbi:hypothetical protein [Micromonospora sp. NPDC049204]|uniref:hypothetical protein n=1 Tax=Micromonospora sp. NPDC049204 TaxID=3154351 RepID=UPI0033E84C15